MEKGSSKRNPSSKPKQARKRAKPTDDAQPVYTSKATNSCWCFTKNNYTEDDILRLKGLYLEPKHKIRYIIIGFEKGKSGTPHLQGFIQFSNRKQFSTVLSLLGGHVHLEPKIPQSTPTQAATYCKKEGNFWERGTLDNDSYQGQGKRNDIVEARDAIKAGSSTYQLMDGEHVGPAMKYFRALQYYESQSVMPRDFKSRVVVFYGDPATFKSYAAAKFKVC